MSPKKKAAKKIARKMPVKKKVAAKKAVKEKSTALRKAIPAKVSKKATPRKMAVTPLKALPMPKPDPNRESGMPGGGRGRIDFVGRSQRSDIRIDPNILEGHPGYEESGSSEFISDERLTAASKRPTPKKRRSS